MREGRRLATCYHEAGHALARWYFGHFSDRAVVLTVADVKAGRWAEGRRGLAVNAEGFVDGYGIHNVPWSMDHIRADPERLRTEVVARDQALIDANAGPTAEAVYRRMSTGLCWFLGGAGDRRTINRILDAWFRGDEAARHNALSTAERRAVALASGPITLARMGGV